MLVFLLSHVQIEFTLHSNAPCDLKVAISSAENPNSLTTSIVCSPNSGGETRKEDGVLNNRMGVPNNFKLPAC